MRRLLLCLLAAVALGVAACGDDESTSDEPSAGATQTQARTQAPPAASGCERAEEPKPKDVEDIRRRPAKLDRGKTYTAVMETTCGTITIRLASREAPKTVASFVGLVRQDFYDGLAFHRIVPGFVAQGGDPAGTGEGGPGYEVVEAPPSNLRYSKGVVAMAKTELDDPGTSGSQFFIVTGDDAGLPPDYALLGRVQGSDDVLARLDEVPNDPSDNKPTEPVVIEDVTIRES
jgi:peptidyl-prolyl cis-trans isomerase B (cyclophilin B)